MVCNNISFRNNHVKANTTVTPRTEGLFGFNRTSDFSTIEIIDNISECYGTTRPLLRNDESCGATSENNTFTNITLRPACTNPSTGNPRGPRESLYLPGALTMSILSTGGMYLKQVPPQRPCLEGFCLWGCAGRLPDIPHD
ncbi:MAG: hypothetical protein GF398_05990 [Chitinivibrionales bacterium]|nr:hypothetical protein [Chitinivibrionales bacterium]